MNVVTKIMLKVKTLNILSSSIVYKTTTNNEHITEQKIFYA